MKLKTGLSFNPEGLWKPLKILVIPALDRFLAVEESWGSQEGEGLGEIVVKKHVSCAFLNGLVYSDN